MEIQQQYKYFKHKKQRKKIFHNRAAIIFLYLQRKQRPKEIMSKLWRSFFGYSDDNPNESYGEAVGRAKQMLSEGNYEDACRILRYAEKQEHAEAMYLLAWCHWKGEGVREDAGRAMTLWRQAAKLEFPAAINRIQELENAGYFDK